MIAGKDIEAVAAFVTERGVGDGLALRLRERWPALHFTCCHDDDIAATRPVRQAAGFNIYLVSGQGGCIGFTTALDAATGLVIAETEE